MNPSKSATVLPTRGSGPDFLCIGQAKAGTGWLYDMLQLDPDFWMPPIKELNFFSGRFPVDKGESLSQKMASDLERLNARRRRSRKKPLDDRDAQFVEHALTYRGKGHSIDWYKDLFAPKANLVSGDITPGNAILADDVIAAIARDLPDLRLVLLLRDPVSRFWSHFNMRQRRKLTGLSRGVKQPGPELTAAFQRSMSVERVIKYLHEDNARKSAFASAIHRNWNRHFDESQISIFFFDDICAAPERVLGELRADLGLPGKAAGGDGTRADFNRKADRMKQDMSDDVRAVLVDAFRDELLRCAELFGGPAVQWPGRYGIA